MDIFENPSPSEESKTEKPSSLLENPKAHFEDTPGVDLCFMIDCTGSMGSYIRMACDKVKDIMKQFKEIYPCSEIRVGIVGYRDVQDPNRFDILPFTYCGDTAKDFLDKLSANGGGDTPEDMNGAFQKMLFQMEWKMPVKIVVHIADAPCHGQNFHDCSDDHPKGYIEDLAWDKIFSELVGKRLDYMFLKITNSTDKMFEKFKALADEKGAIKEELCFVQDLSLYQEQKAPLFGSAPAFACVSSTRDDMRIGMKDPGSGTGMMGFGSGTGMLGLGPGTGMMGPGLGTDMMSLGLGTGMMGLGSGTGMLGPGPGTGMMGPGPGTGMLGPGPGEMNSKVSSLFAEQVTQQCMFSVNREMKKKF